MRKPHTFPPDPTLPGFRLPLMKEQVLSAMAACTESFLLWLQKTASSGSPPLPSSSSGSRGRSAFQWGATVAALFLLILNQLGRKSRFQASLLVLCLVTTFPNVLYNILRGQIGDWIAFIAIIAHLCIPRIFPISRFLLFVITPDWLADELRYSIAGGVFCLAMGVVMIVAEVHATEGFGGCVFSCYCLGYCFSMLLFFFFIVLYLCLGPW